MQKQPIALIGCGLLALGVFAPAVHVPIAGALTYMEVGSEGIASGWITLVIAFLALLAALSDRYSPLWIAGSASLVLLMFSFAHVQNAMGAMRESEAARSSMFGFVADAIRFGWGWPIIACGSIALLIAADIDRRENPHPPGPLIRWLRDERDTRGRRGGKPEGDSGSGVPW